MLSRTIVASSQAFYPVNLNSNLVCFPSYSILRKLKIEANQWWTSKGAFKQIHRANVRAFSMGENVHEQTRLTNVPPKQTRRVAPNSANVFCAFGVDGKCAILCKKAQEWRLSTALSVHQRKIRSFITSTLFFSHPLYQLYCWRQSYCYCPYAERFISNRFLQNYRI